MALYVINGPGRRQRRCLWRYVGTWGSLYHLTFESTRLNVTSLTRHFDHQLSDCSTAGLGAMPLRKIFEVSGPAKSKNVPSIAGSSRVRDGCCHLPRTYSVGAERCGGANGRVICFSLHCETSSLIAPQPYACHTIAGSLAAATRSNQATWVKQIQCSVACCQEGGGHRLRCNQDDELATGQGRFPGPKTSGEEKRHQESVVGSRPELVNCPWDRASRGKSSEMSGM